MDNTTNLAHWMRELLALRLVKHKEAYTDITPEQEAACFWKAQADIAALRKILIEIVGNFERKKTRNIPETWAFARAAHDIYAETQDWDVLMSFKKTPGNLMNTARKIAKQHQLSQVREDKASDVLTQHILDKMEEKRGKENG